jgi:acetophenone carboxylase
MGSGINQWGVPFVSGGGGWTRNTGGQGGRVDSDGMDSAVFRSAVHAPGTDGEETEVNEPTFHLWQKHRKDSCGHGKYRGGASGYIASVVYGVPYIKGGMMRRARGMSARMLIGQGLFGGYPGYATPGVGINRSNLLELMAKGERNIPTTPEEVLRGGVIQEKPDQGMDALSYEGALRGGGSQAGGYGYGDVLERDPQAVVNDIRNEIVSDWSAHHVYHVAYDRETWTADIQATLELRKEEHENRLHRGKPYAEFEEEWLKKKPSEDWMKYYGTWPDARMVRPIVRI